MARVSADVEPGVEGVVQLLECVIVVQLSVCVRSDGDTAANEAGSAKHNARACAFPSSRTPTVLCSGGHARSTTRRSLHSITH